MPYVPYVTSPRELNTTAILVETLRNPISPDSCCARALYVGTSMLTPHEPDTMAKDERQTPILRAIMYFLTCPRSEQEQNAVKQKLSTCACDLRDPVIARLHVGDASVSTNRRTIDDLAPPHLDDALARMCTVATEGLRTLSVGNFRKIRKNTAADAQPWPNSQQDIIPSPDGTKGTVSALLRWATAPPSGYAVFLVLGGIARFWEPLAREIFRTPLAFSLATDHLQAALDHYNERAADSDPVVPNRFHLPFIACANELFLTLVVRDMKATYMAMDPVLKQMMFITLEIQPILRAMGPTADVLDVWFDQLRLSMAEAHRIALDEYAALQSSAPHAMFRQLLYVRNLNQCMHLECTAPLGIKTTVCGGCRIARYCSAECQRPAWRAPRLPHKPICAAIQALRTALQLEDSAGWDKWMLHIIDKDTLTPARRAPPFEALCKSKQVKSEVALGILDGLTALMQAKHVQLDELEKQAARPQ
ncbi:hypothetical protein DFH09DRAFT_1370655 [Mycena vulgaris]|nr:hypothetical protein DFH09DRAFT_1370655 [Mycena vulgaris]